MAKTIGCGAILSTVPRLRRLAAEGCAAAILAAAAVVAQAAPARFPVTSDQVVAAMQNQKLPVEGVHIRMAASITSSVDNAVLEVESMSMLTPHSAQLKVSCHEPGACLAFYASAAWPEQSAPVSLPPDLALSGGLRKSEFGEAKAGRTAYPGEQTLRAGTRAMLLFEDNRIHIRMQVICLESGVPGNKVRVATPDHKQTYVAEIVTPTLLKGTF